jgi:hypothetical protein
VIAEKPVVPPGDGAGTPAVKSKGLGRGGGPVVPRGGSRFGPDTPEEVAAKKRKADAKKKILAPPPVATETVKPAGILFKHAARNTAGTKRTPIFPPGGADEPPAMRQKDLPVTSHSRSSPSMPPTPGAPVGGGVLPASGPQPLAAGVVWPDSAGDAPGKSTACMTRSDFDALLAAAPSQPPVAEPFSFPKEFKVGNSWYSMSAFISRPLCGVRYALPFYDMNGKFKKVPGLDPSLVGRARVTPARLWEVNPLEGVAEIGHVDLDGVRYPVFDVSSCAWCILFGVKEEVWQKHGGLCWYCKQSRSLP